MECFVGEVLVIIVDEGLEVLNLDHLPAILAIVHERVDLEWLRCMLGQQLLNLDVIKQFILSEPENLKGLLFRYETSLDPESFLCDLLPAGIYKL